MTRLQHVSLWAATLAVCAGVAWAVPPDWLILPVDTTGTSLVTGGAMRTSAAQSGTWTVQPGNTANTTAWKVDGSAVTQPVSGTFFQATQPVSGTVTANQGGTWTVQPGNTANTTAWKVDGSAVTQPVSGTVAATQSTSPWVTGEQDSFVHLAANATTTIKSGAGALHTVVINTKGITNTLTLYDNTAGSGTVIAVIDTTLSTTAFVYDLAFSVGLTTVVAGGTAADLTLTYR